MCPGIVPSWPWSWSRRRRLAKNLFLAIVQVTVSPTPDRWRHCLGSHLVLSVPRRPLRPDTSRQATLSIASRVRHRTGRRRALLLLLLLLLLLSLLLLLLLLLPLPS